MPVRRLAGSLALERFTTPAEDDLLTGRTGSLSRTRLRLDDAAPGAPP
jgi:hypothetical protein